MPCSANSTLSTLCVLFLIPTPGSFLLTLFVHLQSADILIEELQTLANLVDALARSGSRDDGPQTGAQAQVAAVQIKGMKVQLSFLCVYGTR